ncbi:hypothetical protein DUNSADRAFT_13316 [Dunaliella salina]|uniref:Encoded protein n=1 Tax=Dunaliella salina TaxID=3046 RepID=A0ABQ7G9N2_DUNSA|nr:hypothetical protein DUNSADRAFT_13316 [Dunaliella salina]|eukprot:KAF5831315.1 hypothetical protein DUNSADRAFT_13316 [Dunaliella salina]
MLPTLHAANIGASSTESHSWAECDRLALFELQLSRANALAACTRLQLNSTVADMNCMLSAHDKQGIGGSVSSGRQATGAAVGRPQGGVNTPSQTLQQTHRDPSHQAPPRQAQATSQHASAPHQSHQLHPAPTTEHQPHQSHQLHPAHTTRHQAGGNPGAACAPKSSSICDKIADDEMTRLLALATDMGSMFGAACRLMRAAQLLLPTASG